MEKEESIFSRKYPLNRKDHRSLVIFQLFKQILLHGIFVYSYNISKKFNHRPLHHLETIEIVVWSNRNGKKKCIRHD